MMHDCSDTISVEEVGKVLREAEGLDEIVGMAVFGSLARGEMKPRSDIDIVVVVERDDPAVDMTSLWSRRLRKVTQHFRRDLTVLVYSIISLKRVPTWHTLRMATDAIPVYDPDGRLRRIFDRIVRAAHEAGLRQEMLAGRMTWIKPDLKPREVFKVEIPDDEPL